MKKLRKLVLLMCLLVTTGGFGFEVPSMTKPPIIDGRIGTAEWQDALLISGAGRKIDPRRAQIYAAWDKSHLYLAMRSEVPPHSAPVVTENSLGPVMDDSLELWFAPPEKERDQEAAKFGQFQLIANSRGNCYQMHHNPGYGLPAKAWNAEVKIANTVHDGVWDMEIAIPAAAFGFSGLKPAIWKILPVRNFRTPPGGQNPFTDCNGFMNYKSFADFELRQDTPAIQNDYSKSSSRLPVRFSTNRPGKFLLKAKIGKNEYSVPLSASRSIDLSEHFSQEKTEALFTIQNADGKIIFSRGFEYEPPPERIWFNPESYIVLEQNFDDSLDKMEVVPTGVAVSVTDQVTAGEGRKPGIKAAYFSEGKAAINYKGMKMPTPGAISMWLKTDGPCRKGYRRFISTNFRSSGYIGLQETQGKLLFFAHQFKGGNRNLMPFKSIPGKEWNHLVINLLPERAELYLNGIRYGEIEYGYRIDPATLGDMVLGGSGVGGFAMDEVTVYGRPLEQSEIKGMAQGEAKITGSISWYQVLNALILDLNCRLGELPGNALELKIHDEKNKVLFQKTVNLNDGYSVNGLRIIRQKIELEKTPPDGEYFASLYIPGSEAPLMEKNFLVKQYPWLHNKLGTEDILLPPFTPLRVSGQTVSCILRDYHLGGNGLPVQITAKGTDILAGPVQLMIESGGKTYCQPDGKLNFTGQKETAVDYTAESTGKDLNVKVAAHMEFDGLLRLDLCLNQLGNTSPERVYIDIPVKKEFARLFHAAGEHIRANPAGFVPPGEGTIWKSRSIPQLNISNFIPYIWVGDDERGISYAADWDRGWIHTGKRDAVELFRHADGNVSIRLNLLNAPVKLEKDHRITIALMASPVKPMPEGWRGWSDGFSAKGTRISKCLMSNPYWGCYTTWTGRYPAFKDFEYIRKLMETRNTGVIDRQFVDSWLKRLQEASVEEVPWLKNAGQSFAVRHTNAAFNIMKGLYPVRDKTTVYFYTCNWTGANELPEFPVFRDEWNPRVHVYQSYADYALYYLEKMLDCGMDGIYNDNTFFAANYNWATGNAYIDENGNIHPSLGLWRIREYHKRQLTLMTKRGMKPWITVHHTNANILPVLSFATNTMGMEWKYGEQDFQERFSPDYIRAVCQGRQGGFFPTVLDGIIAKPEKRTWATRTMLATLLPHEVRPTCPRQCDAKLYCNIHDLMFDFGIAEPDCSFHAYWDKAVPVKSSDPDILVSVYRRGQKMLLVCGSYSNDDAVAKLTADRPVKNARNLETGESLETSGKTVKLPLKKHDFALLELELEP